MTQDFVHCFKGFGGAPSQCLVKIYQDDGENFVCFIDLGVGTSVTNASELLATEIVNEYHLIPSETRFFETYQQYNYDTFDEIEYNWKFENKKSIASHANWTPCTEDQLKRLFCNL